MRLWASAAARMSAMVVVPAFDRSDSTVGVAGHVGDHDVLMQLRPEFPLVS